MPTVNLSRRGFFKGVGAGLVLGFVLPGCRAGLPLDSTIDLGSVLADGDLAHLNAWIQIAPNGVTVLQMPAAEMGQGVFTSLPMILAEELDVDWTMVRAETAPAHKSYRHLNVDFPGTTQATAASLSVRGYWTILRQAGAAARTMLRQAAANRWGAELQDCTTDGGFVIFGDKRASYGELATDAALLQPPRKPVLKDPKDFKLIGTSPPRLDLPSKVDGTAKFGMDVQIQGMCIATIKDCPHFGGTLVSFDDTAARQVPGVIDIFQMDQLVVVVADTFYHAKTALTQVQITWDAGAIAGLDDAWIGAILDEALDAGGKTIWKQGAAIGETTIEARYETPFLDHATLEPLNATAWVHQNRVDIWAPTQVQQMAKASAARLTGINKDNVFIHTTFLGGGMGRKAYTDFTDYAVMISQHMGRAVQVIWTREECFARGQYRPRVLCRQRGALGADGMPTDWYTELVCQNIFAEQLPGFLAKTKLAATIVVAGHAECPYNVPNQRLDYAAVTLPIPIGFWRSVHLSNNGFSRECFLDELAHAAGQDPIDYRLKLLEHIPRLHACLTLAVEQAGMVPEGQHRGVAVIECFGGVVAQVADVSVTDGKLTVHRVTAAIDCGLVVHPDTVKAQVMSGIGIGLSVALAEEITFENGAVQQTNFHNYKLMSLAEMPVVDVHIVPSTAHPGGVGESGLPPTAPAVCNAIFQATGKRIRRLPIGDQLLG
jgi:isoquinoline 1-oxidoreductase beta subunit